MKAAPHETWALRTSDGAASARRLSKRRAGILPGSYRMGGANCKALWKIRLFRRRNLLKLLLDAVQLVERGRDRFLGARQRVVDKLRGCDPQVDVYKRQYALSFHLLGREMDG